MGRRRRRTFKTPRLGARTPLARLRTPLVGLAILLSSDAAEGQDPASQLPGNAVPRNQIAVEAGPTYAFGLSYARRFARLPVLGGFGLGFAWEWNENTFDVNVWEAIHGELFARYVPLEPLQLDLGLSFMQFTPEDDTPDNDGFVGAYLAAAVGYRWVFAGGALRLGLSGGESGVIWNPFLRLVIPWGR